MQRYITGVMVTAGVKPISLILYAYLAFIGLGQWVKDPEGCVAALHNLGWWALPLGAAAVAISPSGILLFIYCVVQMIRNRKTPYGTATLLAPFRAIGYLAFIVQIARTYAQFSGYLLTWCVCHLVKMVPVFGERGGLLNIWVATAVLSWPASWKAWVGNRKG